MKSSSITQCNHHESCFSRINPFAGAEYKNTTFSPQKWLLPFVITFPFLFLLTCGDEIRPMDPTGIPVWSDDGTEIACAILHADFDGRLFMNHETNFRYDIALYDDAGNKVRTLFTDRMIDGFESSVEEIYYMKTKGYLLVKTLMYNCGGRRIEKILLDGTVTILHHLACEDYANSVSMVPSPSGTYIALAYFTNNDNAPHCTVTFLDSTGTDTVSTTPPFEVWSAATVRWQSDTIFEVISSLSTEKMKIMGPSTAVRDSSGEACKLPATSSSAGHPFKGFISFDGHTQSIVFSPTAPAYQDWCGDWYW